jgi:hypothetical protein
MNWEDRILEADNILDDRVFIEIEFDIDLKSDNVLDVDTVVVKEEEIYLSNKDVLV